MRIACWNVNSIRTRVGRVIDWLQRNDVDVLAMQEIKCRPEQFPRAEFAAAGYHLEIHGFNQWNGVAFASRLPLRDVQHEFCHMPGFGKAIAGQEAVQGVGSNGLPLEARALGATIGEYRLWNLYVPNGRSLDDPHFNYKLTWLQALQNSVHEWLAADPQLPLALMGDWNIAPLPADVGDPSFVPGRSTHISPLERQAFAAFTPALSDVVRPFAPNGYTFWDYKAGRFPKDEGLRIDFIMGSAAFADTVVSAEIAREERAGASPSDHVPVLVEVDAELLGAGDDSDFDRPMVF